MTHFQKEMVTPDLLDLTRQAAMHTLFGGILFSWTNSIFKGI